MNDLIQRLAILAGIPCPKLRENETKDELIWENRNDWGYIYPREYRVTQFINNREDRIYP